MTAHTDTHTLTHAMSAARAGKEQQLRVCSQPTQSRGQLAELSSLDRIGSRLLHRELVELQRSSI